VSLLRRLLGSRDRRLAFENLLFRLAALLALGAATVLLARIGGPAVVGHYALLRVLPWLLAMVLTFGYEGAIVYFLARRSGPAPGTRSTIMAIVAVGGLVGAALWFVAAPVIAARMLDGMALPLVRAAAVLVPARALVAVGRQCLQGTQDLRGSNVNIALEAAAFLPLFALLAAAGVGDSAAVLVGLVCSDLVTAAVSFARLARSGFFAGMGTPTVDLARQLCGFGVRTNSGYLLQLLNLRFDVVLVGAITGAATVGTYAIASRFAELILLVPHSVLYVLQPRYTEMDRPTAAAAARRVLRPTMVLTAAAAAPIGLGAGFVLPVVYGDAFAAAARPTQILLVGLVATGAASVMTAFLYGDGRPGLVSIATGLGLVVMVAMDVVLIPSLQAVGAAIASSLSYVVSSLVLWLCFRAVVRSGVGDGGPEPAPPTTAAAGRSVTSR